MSSNRIASRISDGRSISTWERRWLPEHRQLNVAIVYRQIDYPHPAEARIDTGIDLDAK